MFEDYKICPYTGLRPFTEEESIYFKGRDEHIDQATRQLEKNKFIMLTGASGDGKSSLVYAGIIPNAKAGFLKASFSNWSIVDFRPERSPMLNLSKALAEQLGISTETVRTELGYGFSALVDIYKASPLYYDPYSSESIGGDERFRNEKKRKAANLIILADQFEEFFTNPENFEKGVPSQEAMSVTNLLLETARIALEERLPIYVVITMRSDFIGQCAAFRGLPEYIGFSQFFVPRLNRKELREVIEEPAVLSGNTIERRLTERLIHDIVEGTDQLPILQHALNQIWKMADEGQSSMDLIHYAMVGGMGGSELPPGDTDKFNTWFASLSPNVQGCYDAPSLQNVLNTHANKLYSQDADHIKETKKSIVSDEDTKMVIKTAFKCLTKINNSRAVRNRMTLGEITAIINAPHLDYKKVGQILDIFREPGNTLLRPFSEDAPELQENDVLDITHESLIRNWENLEQWAKEEFNSYTISLDFGQQLNRWIESKKSNDFLLYIGPLTYFETWIKDEKPNAAWVARYLKGDQDQDAKLQKANAVQSDATEFLKRSARKHLVTRTVVRYGAGRIAAVLGLIVFLTLSSFVAVNYWQRQNAYVMKSLKSRELALANSPKVLLANRSIMLAESLQAGSVTIPEIIRTMDDPIERINLITGVATQLVYQGTSEPKYEILKSLQASDSLLALLPLQTKNGKVVSNILKEVNDLEDIVELAYFYNPSKEIGIIRSGNAKRAAAWTIAILRAKPETFNDINNLNRTLEHGLNHSSFSSSETEEIIDILSPFDGTPQSSWVTENFSRNKVCLKGFFTSGINFNGLFQELGYLYGATGETNLALQCVDSLLKYNQNYTQNNYVLVPDNASHIAASFYQHGHADQLDKFVQGYCVRAKTTESEFYQRLLARCKLYEFASTATENNVLYDFFFNLSLEYSNEKQLDFFFNKYREVLNRTEKNVSQRDFLLALSYKDEGIIQMRRLEVSGADSLKEKFMPLFDRAIALYRTIDPAFLNTNIDVVEITANDNLTIARKFLFLYPDVRTPFHPNEPNLYHYFFTTGVFLDYMLSHHLFTEFYTSEKELKFIEILLRDYHYVEVDVIYTASERMSYQLLAELEKNIAKVEGVDLVNLEFLYLYLGHHAALRRETGRMLYYYSKLNPEKIKGLFNNAFNTGFPMTLIALAVADLAEFDHFDEAERIVRIFQSGVNRSSLYAYAARQLLFHDIKDAKTDRLIDSAQALINKAKTFGAGETNRGQLAYALALRNRPEDIAAAEKVIKNVETKTFTVGTIARALARNGRLFDASQYANENVSISDNNFIIINIMLGYNLANKEKTKVSPWKIYDENADWGFSRQINYADETN